MASLDFLYSVDLKSYYHICEKSVAVVVVAVVVEDGKARSPGLKRQPTKLVTLTECKT